MGDLLYFNSTKWVRFPKGSSGQVITIDPTGQLIWFDLFAAPTATAENANVIPVEGLKLEGIVNPGMLSTLVKFEVDIDVSYANPITTTQTLISGFGNINVSAIIPEVPPNGTYYFRVVAVNVWGTSYSSSKSFVLNE
ncbi:MAG: hypothetical protein K8R35_08960 [Bacteroidales bacterium]|nr:hypothetical protein [Bacteroidales bacterium]